VAVLVDSVTTGMTDSASAASDIARAEGLVGRALAASPRYAHAHFVKGSVLRARNRWEEAIPEYEAALALNHNFVYALNTLGWCKLYFGSTDEVIPLVEQAIRLSPRDPHIGAFYNLIGTVHLLQSHTDEAIVWFEKARNASPGLPIPRSRLAAACALRGETERAAAELAEARGLSGGDLFSSIAHLKAHLWCVVGGAEDPGDVRSHLFRRPAQGRDAGGMTAAVRRNLILMLLPAPDRHPRRVGLMKPSNIGFDKL
jgi:tetratricopeptide (TPR) repeat protein